jgi:hypothetical protein
MTTGKVDRDGMRLLCRLPGWDKLRHQSMWEEINYAVGQPSDEASLRLRAFLWGRMLGRAEGLNPTLIETYRTIARDAQQELDRLKQELTGMLRPAGDDLAIVASEIRHGLEQLNTTLQRAAGVQELVVAQGASPYPAAELADPCPDCGCRLLRGQASNRHCPGCGADRSEQDGAEGPPAYPGIGEVLAIANSPCPECGATLLQGGCRCAVRPPPKHSPPLDSRCEATEDWKRCLVAVGWSRSDSGDWVPACEQHATHLCGAPPPGTGHISPAEPGASSTYTQTISRYTTGADLDILAAGGDVAVDISGPGEWVDSSQPDGSGWRCSCGERHAVRLRIRARGET